MAAPPQAAAKPPDPPAAVRDDIFFARFLARVPPRVAETFTLDQLNAIKLAFGARTWGVHAVDIRLSIPLLFARFYVVFLLGRERRDLPRRGEEGRASPLARLGNLLVTALFAALVASSALGVLYLVKSLLGIDLIADGGAHAALGALGDMLDRLLR